MWRITRLCCKQLIRDESLVSLPPAVHRLEVYRNAVSVDCEERICAELGLLLQREGHTAFAEGSTPQQKIVKHTYLELHGAHKDFTEVKSFQRKETRRLPGLLWSPTLVSWMNEVVPRVRVFPVGVMPDTARVVEHNMTGYEMHMEHPTVGCSFLYLSLLSDTVLTFDDEATGRYGEVFLPQRALMCCSGEIRWGWRFGEQSREVHTFVNASGVRRVVEPDLRLSVQLWKFTPQLLDARLLQDRVEESMKQREAEESNEVVETIAVDRKKNEEEHKGSASSHALFSALAEKGASGTGPLGGEYVEGRTQACKGVEGKSMTMEDIGRDYNTYKQQFQNVHGVLQEMKALQDAGQPINDMWLRKRILDGQKDDNHDAQDGFDPNDVEGTWDRVDAKARFYKARLKGMDYDGTANSNSSMPDVTEDAPLDMKKTIQKIAPLVKDGDKILASLPCGQ
ncbi:uncharacterized protein TEOVI_000440000 [Trypanosoma equiperdum]|uniref:Fe2OG dioxygenase domain-containing protein n=3 Tax=Trypanozoon TaxID=39700 RepID=Q586C4_TRYB2|nr:hypothetical protein, conserved [Trypanosoma brucei brucei TREU927]AAQ16046.1 hypothetical protein, conserved [Trypanosoma brucei brucei TREU927]AAX79008.1 hypothetical protein, conserved [Trypanosoma brucei]SCU72816.1 hypothetical protein, conserved [Trypanosoma equiperdum]